MTTPILNYLTARQSPCNACDAPCCSYLPLVSFFARTLKELDQVNYFLNFENIAIKMSSNGEWHVYQYYSCRYLNADDHRCSLHGTPQKPTICVGYDPFSCYYKSAVAAQERPSAKEAWIDRNRFEFLCEQISFDDQRTILHWPDTGQLIAQLNLLPFEKPVQVTMPPDSGPVEWKAAVRSGARAEPERGPLALAEAQNPCTTCSAHCCTNLVFSKPVPTTLGELDFFRFALGFPTIQIGISDSQWALILRTRCRHLTAAARCAVFGQLERPLQCEYFDATSCRYRIDFTQAQPPGMMRVELNDYVCLLEAFNFDNNGAITEPFTTQALQDRLEQSWCET